MTTPIASELITQLRAARDQAADASNLPRALELDNELEDLAQLGNSPRRTCGPCGSWADHVHEPRTGERMLVHGGQPADDQHIATAVQVFALAESALPHHWSDTDSGAQVVVDLAPHRYVVTVHTGYGSDPRPRAVYISRCVDPSSGRARAFPAIHATQLGTAAIIYAYRLARPFGPVWETPAKSSSADDPDELLARFRARQNEIDAEIDAHDGDHDTSGGHHDRLAALHREASELMAALDNHLSLGGSLPRAWAHARTA
ncbi:hypothetical protein [Nocardia wallacei]|uniref:hypothetical protein n=1 Tax=Nocardia wallacei TaxID=480035 RepID=UPI002458659A|nr:hypothetical protein [Nocardia wallacei]